MCVARLLLVHSPRARADCEGSDCLQFASKLVDEIEKAQNAFANAK